MGSNLYAHKSFLVHLNRAESDGILQTMEVDLPVRKGELIATDQRGRQTILTDDILERDYVPVEKVQMLVEKPKKKNPFAGMSDEQLTEAYGQSWVNNDVDESDLAMLAELDKEAL